MFRGGFRGWPAVCAVLLIAGCSFPIGASPTPSPSPTLPPASPTPTASPTVAPTPTATPEPGSVPVYQSGQVVAANADGLRVRSLPSTNSRILIPLSLGVEVVVVIGPIYAEGYGWYLVADPAPTDPAIPEGWVAAGVTPEPFLAETSTPPLTDVFVAGWSYAGDAQNGPVLLQDAHYALRWVAAPTAGEGCSFAVDLVPGSGPAVPAIRSTVGQAPTPGNLYEDFFAAHPELRGDVFVQVTTGCQWSLAFQRTPTLN